jgi:hypothetical protein
MREYTVSPKQELFKKFQIAYQLLGCEKENQLIKKNWKKLCRHSSLRPVRLSEMIRKENLISCEF